MYSCNTVVFLVYVTESLSLRYWMWHTKQCQLESWVSAFISDMKNKMVFCLWWPLFKQNIHGHTVCPCGTKLPGPGWKHIYICSNLLFWLVFSKLTQVCWVTIIDQKFFSRCVTINYGDFVHCFSETCRKSLKINIVRGCIE